MIVEIHPRVHLLNLNEIKKPISTKIGLSIWYSHSNRRPELNSAFSVVGTVFLNMIFGCYTHVFEFIACGGKNPFSCLSFIQLILMLNIQSIYSVITF